MFRIDWLIPCLVGSLLVNMARAEAPPVATVEQVNQTVDRAITYLEKESASWLRTRRCAACHHVPMPIWALSEAHNQGYQINRPVFQETVESLLGSKEKLMASRIFPDPAAPPDPRPQGRGLNMGLPFLAVAAGSIPDLTQPQRQSLKLITEEVIRKQQADGSWEFFAGLRRPPINETQLTDAAWIILSLQDASGTDSTSAESEALTKANAWIAAQPVTGLHQEMALKLLLAARAGKSLQEAQPAVDELISLQRNDGGWSQTVPDLKSDAFATGQSLYVLLLAGIKPDHAAIRRGTDFLVATQLEDGSWPMVSRSTPDGSEGSARLMTPINCAAASWAALGLVRAVPRTP